ncbi:hypothetical protein P691DRAFT_802161 [Macrolepiota fuliginosa MF-IS2]|uniref:HIT-type domain-containing protein n=1 Tax=Macrolepiota fuliginosa MF-IS2 TaxID=1400762 RepID=A0A9P5XC44_9AGAR|nr:hypothetical protein P691DRAFT_802161 [Macrolepiota fuliginosa MF-IS2]
MTQLCSSSSAQNNSPPTISPTVFDKSTPTQTHWKDSSPDFHTENLRRPRLRKRTPSLFSTSSTTSSIFDFYNRLTLKTEPSLTTSLSTTILPVTSVNRKDHLASGSFIPNPSPATDNLRSLITSNKYDAYGDDEENTSYYTPRGRSQYPRHSSRLSKQSLPIQTNDTIPSITRSLSISSSRTPSPSPPRSNARLGRTPTKSSHRRRPSQLRILNPNLDVCTGSSVFTDLHPILAKLEKESKLCKVKARCSTCGKIGAGFPVCGRCGEMWCSRECRIGEGRRHVCRNGA